LKFYNKEPKVGENLNPSLDSIADCFYFEMHSRALQKAILGHNENLMIGESEKSLRGKDIKVESSK